MGLSGLSCLQHMDSLFRHAGSFIEVHILSLVAVLTLRHVGSEFPDQGSNPRPLHCKVNSQPLDHQGSPQGAPSIPSGLLRVSPPTSSSPRPGLGDSENWTQCIHTDLPEALAGGTFQASLHSSISGLELPCSLPGALPTQFGGLGATLSPGSSF